MLDKSVDIVLSRRWEELLDMDTSVTCLARALVTARKINQLRTASISIGNTPITKQEIYK